MRTYYKSSYPSTNSYQKSYYKTYTNPSTSYYKTYSNPTLPYSKPSTTYESNSHSSYSYPEVSASYLLQPYYTYEYTTTSYNTDYYNVEPTLNNLPPFPEDPDVPIVIPKTSEKPEAPQETPEEPDSAEIPAEIDPSQIPEGFDPELAELADLLGLFPTETETKPKVAKPNNVVEVIAKSENLKNVASLVNGLGLAEELSTAPQVTIFAPSDLAFRKFYRGTTMAKDLKRHVIGVKLPSANIETGPAATLSGDVINLVKNSDSVQIEYNGKVINVVQADISASNGVIHVVDQVIG